MDNNSHLYSRFWKSVDKTDTCWVWTKALDRSGYGAIKYGPSKEERTQVHRLAWELYYGPIPRGLHVLHTCDNPACVCPRHLWIGTNAQNIADKVAKGRQLKGEQCKKNAKLKESEVREILTKLSVGIETQTFIAWQYGISLSTISAIKHKRLWAHITL